MVFSAFVGLSVVTGGIGHYFILRENVRQLGESHQRVSDRIHTLEETMQKHLLFSEKRSTELDHTIQKLNTCCPYSRNK